MYKLLRSLRIRFLVNLVHMDVEIEGIFGWTFLRLRQRYLLVFTTDLTTSMVIVFAIP